MIPRQYLLTETPSANYVQRTEWNVRDSDGTLIFTLGAKLTGGSLKTVMFAQKHRKPFLHVHPGLSYRIAEDVVRFVSDNGIKVLNIAGSRGSKEPYVGKFVQKVLEEALFWSEAHPTLLGGVGEG